MVKVALSGTTNWCFWEIGLLALHLDAEEMLEKMLFYFLSRCNFGILENCFNFL